MIEIARLAEEAGIDGLIVSAGTPGGRSSRIWAKPTR